MLGASIYVVPFMIQRNVPGIGPYVLPAFVFASVPAILAAFAYSILASAMPRAGGSYIYASRSLGPYAGFVASFSQWFGLSFVIGAVSYVIIPFFRDISLAVGWSFLAEILSIGHIRALLALSILWLFVLINIRGVKSYERTVIPLMIVMFLLGLVVISCGLIYTQADFEAAVVAKGIKLPANIPTDFNWLTFLSAAALLFSSFIGFDSIAQAGGEAKNPSRTIPLAISVAVVVVGSFYFLFTASMYHVVPWQFVEQQALKGVITAPGLLGYLLPGGWAVVIVLGAAVALTNDLPAMLLSVSRLMFAWAEDGIFDKRVAAVHPKYHSPVVALVVSGCVASVGILGCYVAGDFFLGVDIMVTSMLVNFLMMCISVLVLPSRNPKLANEIQVIRKRSWRTFLAGAGVITISTFLVVHVFKDIASKTTAWYFHSTPIWIAVMVLGSLIYRIEINKLKRSGADCEKIFSELPPE